MRHFGRFSLAMIAFVLLFAAFGANLAAEGSEYFDTVTVNGVPCYVVPEALDDMEISDDTMFFLPVGVYDGYEAMFGVAAAFSNSGVGLAAEAADEFTNAFYKIWSSYDYSTACLNDEDAAAVGALWKQAKNAWYNDVANDDPLMVIYNCLPNWAFEMRSASWEISFYLKEVYDFVTGDSGFDSLDELMEWYGEDFVNAVEFVNVYFPDLEF
jgi:hypothetical protein